MSRRLLLAMILLIGLIACKKNAQTSPYAAFYGQWQWIGSYWGPAFTPPPADTLIILTLNPPNLYEVSLNGVLSTQGTFQINKEGFQFNNMTQPFSNQTIFIASSGETFIIFNHSQTGPLTLFQYNWYNSPADTLLLTQQSPSAELSTNIFKRL
jgi:hypothetical protein